MTTPSQSPADRGPDEDRFSAVQRGGEPPLSGCELVESVAAELALGSLTGEERSYALDHLDDCQSCRQLVEELTAAADSLLLIAAEADPPAGFEVRLLERLKATGGIAATAGAAAGTTAFGTTVAAPFGGPAPVSSLPVSSLPVSSLPVSSLDDRRARFPHRFATRARVVLAAAAVAVAAAGVGLGLEVAPRTAPSVSALGSLRVASLDAAGGPSASPAGEVVVTAGKPSWVLMTVNVHATGWVTCQVEVQGREVPIGTFELYGGKGSWAAPLKASGATVTSARVVGSNGQVLATADFGRRSS